MVIDIFTLFPNMFSAPFDESIIKRAQEKGLVDIRLHNIRDAAQDKHQTVDDTPFGGGAGMLMKVDVLITSLETVLAQTLPAKKPGQKIFLLSPKGEMFTQNFARDLAKVDHLVLICGRYEGVDDRIVDFIDGEISVGSYVLSGGELGAMVVTDAIVRLLPGAIAEESTIEESFSEANVLEYPQYTKPAEFRGKKVPDVLASGNHKAISTWRQEHTKKAKH